MYICNVYNRHGGVSLLTDNRYNSHMNPLHVSTPVGFSSLKCKSMNTHTNWLSKLLLFVHSCVIPQEPPTETGRKHWSVCYLTDGGFEDVAYVPGCRFVPLAEGQRVGIYSTLHGLSLGPGQSGQKQRVVYILAVLADEGRQTGIRQPLLLLFTVWHTKRTDPWVKY